MLLIMQLEDTTTAPTCSYIINKLIEVLQKKMKQLDPEADINIIFNNHTSKVTIISMRKSNFDVRNFIGRYLVLIT